MEDVVERFQRIKSESKCDDLSAAILTLAESISHPTVDVQVSDSGYPERIGGDIAHAINLLTQAKETPVVKKKKK